MIMLGCTEHQHELDSSKLNEIEKEFFNNNTNWGLANFISFLEKNQEVDKEIHRQWKCALYHIMISASANEFKLKAKEL